MRDVRIHGMLNAAALLVAVGLVGGSAGAQAGKPPYDPRAASPTDTNHDGASTMTSSSPA
jgi:hypothetical protein